jgi:hypothetical protein
MTIPVGSLSLNRSKLKHVPYNLARHFSWHVPIECLLSISGRIVAGQNLSGTSQLVAGTDGVNRL